MGHLRASLSIFLTLVAVTALRCPNVAFVVHSNSQNDHVTTFMSETFLHDTNLVVVSGHDTFDTLVTHEAMRDRRRLRLQHQQQHHHHQQQRQRKRKLNLRRIEYDGNPGGWNNAYSTGGHKYLGTHRTMAGVLMATDIFPDAAWVYVLDDDNVINVESICETLSSIDATVPLLLGTVGPGRGEHAPCREISSDDGNHFTCCQDVTRPCLANLATPNKSSLFVYDKEKDTMVPQSCDTGECCEVLPWPEGMMYGFPYRRRNKYDYDVTVSFSSHVVSNMYPYGGGTYALSKAMFTAVGRENWEHYMYALQCTNADISIMTTVFNHGYSIHDFTGFFAPHHRKTVEKQFQAFFATNQTRDVYAHACKFHAVRQLEEAKLLCAFGFPDD